MANRFHFNPDTGRTGVCEAKRGCRFGQSEDQHGVTREEARANYEAHMATELIPATATQAREPLSSPDLPKGIDPTPIDPSTMKMDGIPEGMHRVTVVTGSSLRDYERPTDPRLQKDFYIGGKHRVMDRARAVRVSDGSKVWAIPVMTGSSRGTLFFPMREHIPVAIKYSPESIAYSRERDEENRRLAAERSAASARREREALADRLQRERIESTPYEELSIEDQAAADRMRAEAEEQRWVKDPEPLLYGGPNSDTDGNINERGQENSFLGRLRGVPDYDLMDYNNRVETLANSDLPREEQERLIREERVNYIQSMNDLLDRREALARTARAPRKGFRAIVRSLFEQSEEDQKAQKVEEHSVNLDRQATREFAERLFRAPLYTQLTPRRHYRRY